MGVGMLDQLVRIVRLPYGAVTDHFLVKKLMHETQPWRDILYDQARHYPPPWRIVINRHDIDVLSRNGVKLYRCSSLERAVLIVRSANFLKSHGALDDPD